MDSCCHIKELRELCYEHLTALAQLIGRIDTSEISHVEAQVLLRVMKRAEFPIHPA